MGKRKTDAERVYEERVALARDGHAPYPEPWEEPKTWIPNYVVAAINVAQSAGNNAEWWSSGELEMEGGERWEKFTPEARDRYVELLDDAVTALRRVRAALVARDWRTCEGCGERFIGTEGQRYHSAACKQKAYRARQRLSAPEKDGVCGVCHGTGWVPFDLVYPKEADKDPDAMTACPRCSPWLAPPETVTP